MMKASRRMWLLYVAVASVLLSLCLLGGCYLLEVDDGDAPPPGGCLLGEPAPLPAPVPRTGQTQAYDYNHVDDGGLRRGVAWPSPRFTDHGDGTVTDQLTGLVWLKDADCLGERWWETAFTAVGEFNNGTECDCADYTAGAYSDWRMPNVRELFSLIDFSQSAPALPAGHPFEGVQSTEYWTSTNRGMVGPAWIVNLANGMATEVAKMRSHNVWPVRGGS